MKDPYTIATDQARERWRASSLLLQNQIKDLDELAERIKTPRMAQQIQDHIDFLIDLNNSVDDYVEQSSQLIHLQQFQTGILNETIQAYATKDLDFFKQIIKKLR